MKTYFIIICCLFFSMHTSAQYTPMLEDDHTWKCHNYGLIYMTFQLSIGEDVTENDVTYKSLMYQSGNDEAFQFGLLREDINEQKVYLLNGDEEVLLYDFSLEINDQATVHGLGDLHTITVTDVTTTIVDGTARKKIKFSNDGPGGEWIEGIGSLFGVSDAALSWVSDYSPAVTCFYKGNALAWDNPDVNGVDCSLTLGIEDPEDFALNIFPNPAQDLITIVLPAEFESAGSTINVYDPAGNLVLSNTGRNRQINIESLAQGTYLIECNTNNGLTVRRKFFKI